VYSKKSTRTAQSVIQPKESDLQNDLPFYTLENVLPHSWTVLNTNATFYCLENVPEKNEQSATTVQGSQYTGITI